MLSPFFNPQRGPNGELCKHPGVYTEIDVVLFTRDGVKACLPCRQSHWNPVAVCFPYQYTPASEEPLASQKEVLKCDRPNRALVFQRVARLYRQVFRHLGKR